MSGVPVVTPLGYLYCAACAARLEIAGEPVLGPPHDEEACEGCGRRADGSGRSPVDRGALIATLLAERRARRALMVVDAFGAPVEARPVSGAPFSRLWDREAR